MVFVVVINIRIEYDQARWTGFGCPKSGQVIEERIGLVVEG